MQAGRGEVMAAKDLKDAEEPNVQEELGGGRFNRLILWFVLGAMVIGGVVLCFAIENSRKKSTTEAPRLADDTSSGARDRGEIEDLAEHGAAPHAGPTALPPPRVVNFQPPAQHTAPKPPGRYAQW